MKRVERDKKGVSPIVAVAILVLIAVVAGVLLWTWLSGFVSAATAQQPALGERIKIEAVSASTGSVTAYVRNVGGAQVSISRIYVLSAAGTIVGFGTSTATINPGEVGTVSVSVSLSRGTTYTVKVVTKNGVEATYTFVVP